MYVFFAHIFEVSDNISSMFCTKNLFSGRFLKKKKTLSAGLNKQNISSELYISNTNKQYRFFVQSVAL